ncbi:MAG: aminotransferase [Chloroflexi bacterium HGW-Chloroflexi-10]|nr:MAG: aminotransferase [Chloroflexi bacterium HGW-Chloroflexi-10]
MQTLWDHRFALRTQNMQSSTIRELLKFTQQPDVISFAGGMPAPEIFPIDEFAEASNLVLKEQGAEALQYSTTEGYLPLREMIARHTNQYGINVTADNIMITNGSQQALDLIGKIFINPGDRILVESPTYLGALQAWNAYNAQYVSVPLDQDGIKVDQLEHALRAGPKFMYVLPNFQNPTGVTIPLERRKFLVELADRYGVPIIEDDPYGQLRFEGKHIPAIEVLDDQLYGNNCSYHGNVIYLSTFSKILAPGIRLAWVVATPEIIQKMVMAKQGTDLSTPAFNQMIAYEVGKGGFLNGHIQNIINVYRDRRDIMLEELQNNMPDGVNWTHPQGGLFLWATLPDKIDTSQLLKIAVGKKVAFVPGVAFHPDGSGKNTMRLNFSNAKPEMIRLGIRRLAESIKESL